MTSVVLTVHFVRRDCWNVEVKDLLKSSLISAPGHTGCYPSITISHFFTQEVWILAISTPFYVFVVCSFLNIIDSYGLKTVYATLMPT